MDSDLDRVKKILLGEEYAELLELKNEYQNSEAFAAAVGRVVAEALETRSAEDERIAQVLAPIIDGAISNSIDQDPKKLAESLYPIMGPAIRKSISETLQQMLENFNQLLEQSLSPRSLAWRFDAWRTGRSYSELVLLNTLEYHVEQVYLIHRETSLLMQHVYSDMAERKDPDMVSSMFSAIQDFIQDSFSVNEGDVLDTLRLGELSVVIQSGPQAVLAAVVRGAIPDHLRSRMQDVSERIHRVKRADLQAYSGDPSDFLDVEEDVRSILEARQKQEEEKGFPWLAVVAIVVGAGVFGYISWQEYEERTLRQSIVDSIDAVPGVVVLSTDRLEGEHVITALVDPLAASLDDQLVPQVPEKPASRLVSYTFLSADDEIVLKRVTARVPPPEGVTYELTDGILAPKGRATVQWYAAAAPRLDQVTGVNRIDQSGLALHDPIAERRTQLVGRITEAEFTFDKEATEIDPSDDQIIALARWMNELLATDSTDADRFVIVGYTDESGSELINRRISQGRADALKAALEGQGVPGERMEAISSFEYHGDAIPFSRAVRIHLVSE